MIVFWLNINNLNNDLPTLSPSIYLEFSEPYRKLHPRKYSFVHIWIKGFKILACFISIVLGVRNQYLNSCKRKQYFEIHVS